MIRKDDDVVGSMLHDVAHLIRLKVDDALKPFGLTRVAWLAIGIIAEHDKLTQSELAEYLELGAAATGKLVDRLEERGVVARAADPSDRRTNLLSVTAEAERLMKQLEPIGAAIREDILQDLDAEEREQLADMLIRIKARLKNNLAAAA